MRIAMGSGLTGKYAYWYVSAINQASEMTPLPAPGADGLITLPIPAAYNQPGAQMRVLDVRQGRVAHIQVVDWSRTPLLQKQQLSSNLLQNAGFTGRPDDWKLEQTAPASGVMKLLEGLSAPPGVTGRVVRFDITALGTQNWHVQFYQPGVDLREGRLYLLAFWAKADRSRALTIDTILDEPNWRKVGLTTSVGLGPQWRKYSLVFTARGSKPRHTRVSFVLGDAPGAVDLAGVSLREVEGADLIQPATPQSAVSLTPADFN
jgi:hypothetical protein